MDKIYLITLSIGLILLLLNVLTSGITDFFQGIGPFGIGNLDLNTDLFSSFLPLSQLEICAFLVGFGGMGKTLIASTPSHLIFAILCGFVFSFTTKKLLRYLKGIDSSTLTDLDLIGKQGTVITTIFEHSVGCISLDTKVGKITYAAKSSKTLSQGTTIKVIDVVNHTLIVSDDLNAPLLTSESTLKF